jgi:hypothetical protein
MTHGWLRETRIIKFVEAEIASNERKRTKSSDSLPYVSAIRDISLFIWNCVFSVCRLSEISESIRLPRTDEM